MLINEQFIGPKTYLLSPTAQVPNSRFPIILYRQAIANAAPESTAAAIQPNGWLGAVNGKRIIKHIFMLLGDGPGGTGVGEDGKEIGVKVRFERDDVFVLQAGVSHCVFEDFGGFEYVGFYPPNPERAVAGEEPFDMHLCNASPEETAALAVIAAKTPIPSMDPLYGVMGLYPHFGKRRAFHGPRV
ncbi:hypothetical protein HYFRA_00001835 [Hymenoscyphus fraxineus]|uniref:Cupin type-1 domain-containing protein n=1 Tax=Hymenoscyphus fraxineus TaxID=746836 RepID=A0A9N9KK59_9HELO|nr:hypothetical protein HYFRA_00001835 [Hymenoscyphus fraxineus]